MQELKPLLKFLPALVWLDISSNDIGDKEQLP
jgi:hypothetical protein